jgi:hypothetical protein
MAQVTPKPVGQQAALAQSGDARRALMMKVIGKPPRKKVL